MIIAQRESDSFIFISSFFKLLFVVVFEFGILHFHSFYIIPYILNNHHYQWQYTIMMIISFDLARIRLDSVCVHAHDCFLFFFPYNASHR